MKKTLRPEDHRAIERYKASPTAEMLREYLSWSEFQIGDVLVRRHKKGGDLTMVSEACPVPRKWKIVHIDELKVPWVKQISVRGGLGKAIYPLIEMTVNAFTYEIDPERLEAELFDYKYDPRIEYKRMRDSNPDYGKNDE